MNSCSLQNPTFNGVLADNIMKKHPEKVIKKLERFFNTVRQAIFHFKPIGSDCRKAKV